MNLAEYVKELQEFLEQNSKLANKKVRFATSFNDSSLEFLSIYDAQTLNGETVVMIDIGDVGD